MAQTCVGIRDESHYNVLNSTVHLPKVVVEKTVPRICWHRKFHAVRKYGLHGDNRLRYGHIPFLHKYDRVFFFDLLIDEYNLRMNMQEQERIERKMNSLCPPLGSDDPDNEEWLWDVDEAGIDYSDLSPLLLDSPGSCHEERPKSAQVSVSQKTLHPRVTKSHEKGIKILQHKLDDTKYQHSQLSRKLYETETMFPDLVKQNYEAIRKDPKWYMRKELVKDCADRGGCCGRDCGCCASRAKHYYIKGIGHCTVECFCCVGFRGFRPSPEEKKDILKGMIMILKCDIATHFVRMVNAYFSKS
ncbi:hypothetical protein N7468_001526 [Penicillium chermesinum]|uniref:Uncharacterized protein n=1 Tax=Penicillium chermesinum TaxID=63820 RepID=A0A9W9PGS0_9EURO|nr:uncharacterized protein N7468_001526 [Penicillium chermesinum]KAJ5246543.1 hypothetical protein N7468_001526 [Penicillium chermesinum]KAJ6144811.1 hypothetical protein N7470_008706 [Penicillium chermesinum]